MRERMVNCRVKFKHITDTGRVAVDVICVVQCGFQCLAFVLTALDFL
jgi:hypothetical protein